MKIFIGLTEIAGYFGNLKKGFDELGIDSSFVSLDKHPFKYNSPEFTNDFIIQYRYFLEKYTSTAKSQLLIKVWWKVLMWIMRIFLFIWAIRKFDVFVFGFGTSFFKLYDLPILRLLGKRIICVYFGSDTRPAFIGGASWIRQGKHTEKVITSARKQKNHLKRTERYAHLMVNHVATAHFHERPFIPWFCIGIPVSLDTNIVASVSPSKRIRILHAPSFPEAKGTPQIRAAIAYLQESGYPIDFIEVTGKIHTEVLQELATCDFVIDQLYSDTPMAVFATEAAFMGKPAIVGGYAQELIQQTTPKDMIPPSLFCRPEELVDAIEKMINDVDYRQTVGKQAQQFVTTQWSPKKVAERYVQLIKGVFPQEWFFNPAEIRYLQGGGFSEQQARDLVRSVIEQGGKEALQLADKPDLERLFVDFANN
jgi:glycosyltransferase involved in cell wall biosynthesis